MSPFIERLTPLGARSQVTPGLPGVQALAWLLHPFSKAPSAPHHGLLLLEWSVFLTSLSCQPACQSVLLPHNGPAFFLFLPILFHLKV